MNAKVKDFFTAIYFVNLAGDIVSFRRKGVTFLRKPRRRRSALMTIPLPDYGKDAFEV